MQAYRTLGLPCPWAPLQSITAAASREVPFRRKRVVYLRGKATSPLGTACYASGSGTHTRRYEHRASVVGRGKPQPAAKPERSRRVMHHAVMSVGRSLRSTLCAATCDIGPCRALAEASTCHGTQSRVTAPRANIVRNELRLNPGRSTGTSASSKPPKGPKPQSWQRSHPVGTNRPKPTALARALSGFVERDISPKRSGTRTVRPKAASHP